MLFGDSLYAVMCRTGMTQSQLHRLTGISRSAISQYLSGKNTPSEARQKEIAEALGLPDDYFHVPAQEQKAIEPKISRLTVADAAKLMGLSRPIVAAGLRDGVFPWGYAIKGRGDSWVYWINARRFAEIEGLKEDKGA